jgi:D-alanyl-D-alanine carboxypeptidase/D-alanyl-D-alanine-endopeptidase (penicillin-binding protein 4)
VTLALACAALAGCGAGHGAPSRPAGSPRAGTAAGRAPARTSPTSAASAVPRVPAPLVRLRRALARALRSAGPQTGAEVVDLGARTQLFTLRANTKRPPASVEKLYTTVAVLSRLGPDARLRTTVFGTGHLAAVGVWRGNLYLHGGGDPTFGDSAFNRIWELGYGSTASDLAVQLIARGIRRVAGSIIGDASLFDSRRGGPATGYAPDVPDFGGQLSALTYDHGSSARRLSPGAFAARELMLILRSDHVRAKVAKRTRATPRDAHVLASVSSPPMSVVLRLTDVPSDDLYAELLTKQLGSRFGTGGSISAGARVITDVVHGYHLHPRILDGSGLSREDRSSPLEVVDLLRDLWRTPVGARLSASLPVVGVDGTVRAIATRTAARQRCIAKTGTLDDVTNLAGYCHSRGHHLLAFALFLDGPTNQTALAQISRMVAAIARY